MEQLFCYFFYKDDGEEYGNQCNGGRDDSEENFFSFFDVGFFWRYIFFNVDIDVFCYYDSVVYYQIYCQYNSQYGEYVDGEVCQIYNEESID